MMNSTDAPVTDAPVDIAATAILAEGQVTVRLNAPILSGDLTCAFYLLEHGIRAAQRWYTNNILATFGTRLTDPRDLSVVVFLRHGQGKPLITTISVHTQNPVASPETDRGSVVPRVAIFGSCVSADAIFGQTAVARKVYMARSSLASQVGADHVDSDILDRLSSSFQKNIVRADMDKSLWALAEAGDFDILLFDFIDDRFDMLNLPYGAIHTLSDEYVR
jgi:hypothetical protein